MFDLTLLSAAVVKQGTSTLTSFLGGWVNALPTLRVSSVYDSNGPHEEIPYSP